MVSLHLCGQSIYLHVNPIRPTNSQRGDRALTIRVKTLPRRLTASNKLARRFSDQSDYERKMLERVMAASRIEYVSKQILAFK